jgi:hypothetical protein
VVVVVVGALTAGLGSRQAGRHKSFRPLRRVGSSILQLCLRPDKRKEEAGEGGRKGEGRRASSHRTGREVERTRGVGASEEGRERAKSRGNQILKGKRRVLSWRRKGGTAGGG